MGAVYGEDKNGSQVLKVGSWGPFPFTCKQICMQTF